MRVLFSRSFRRRSAAWFAPRKPRHRLLRVGVAVIGLGLLAVLLVFGLVVGAVMLTATLLLRAFRQRGKPLAARAQPANVVEGEYRVIRRPVLGAGR